MLNADMISMSAFYVFHSVAKEMLKKQQQQQQQWDDKESFSVTS